MEQTHEFKKPLVLRLLIYSFLVAPFGNIALTAISLGIKNWYYPHVFLNIILHVENLDLLWLCLIFLAGVLLTTHHRTAWACSIIVLSLTVLINIRNFIHIMQTSSAITMALVQTSFSLLATLAVGVVFYYFRYPYMDRRGTLLGFAPRFDVHIPSQIFSEHLGLDCECQSLSISGARLTLQSDSLNLKAGDSVQIRFADSPEKFETSVIEYSKNILRLRFIELNSNQKSQLAQLAKDYHQGKLSPKPIKTAV